MNHPHAPLFRRAAKWLLALSLLLAGWQAFAQDPPGRIARLNFHQGTVSFSPAGDDSWYDVVPNRPMTTGDRLWTDRNARAELHVGSAALRMDDQTSITLSELDDDTARITSLQGNLQLRVRDDPAGQRFEIDTPNLSVVIDAPGDYRIDVDPASDTTRVAVAAGAVTLYGEGGESVPLGARQQLTVAGRDLSAVSGARVQASGAFDQWVAERNRIEDQSISARYVSRDVVGYQQLDRYGDWQNDPNYGAVWYPRDVDADWAPYREGQWVDVAPWGWTWVDAAPWGFAPSHYGRWARIGPRWGWVPGPRQARPVYAPAVVGFVGGTGGAHASLAIGGGRNGVGWFPLAPGEAWRPGFRASQRYIDDANRAAAQHRQMAAREAGFAHYNTPGAVTVVPVDVFGRGRIGRRDLVRLPEDRLARIPVESGVPIPLRGERPVDYFGRPVSAVPPAALQARQQQLFQAQQREFAREQRDAPRAPRGFERRQEREEARQQQQFFEQRAAQGQALQMQQLQQAQQAQQAMQLQQAQQMQQRAAQQQQQQLMQQRAAQAQAQQQMQQQQALRQQQEMQQRAAQAQAQQAQQLQMQQQALRAQQQMQALQAQQQLQAQQLQQQNAMRQAQEAQQRAQQQQRQQQAQRPPGQPPQGGGLGLSRNEPLGIGDRP